MRFTISAVLILALGFSACKDEFEVRPYTYTKLFTGEVSKTWQIKFIEETLDGEIIGRFADNCFTDDQYTFFSNSERLYSVKSGSRKCGNESSEVVSTWSFVNSTASMNLIIPILVEGTLTYTVRELDNDDMTLEFFFNEEATESYRFHFELTDEE